MAQRSIICEGEAVNATRVSWKTNVLGASLCRGNAICPAQVLISLSYFSATNYSPP